MTTIVYPGTFDPITNGHIDLIERAAPLFERLLVAVAASPRKRPALSLEQRVTLASEVLSGIPNVEVIGFDGLTTDFLIEQEARVLLRGLRSSADFDYELQLAQINRIQLPGTESLFMAPAPENACISSTIVREIARLHGDVSRLVPAAVAQALSVRFADEAAERGE